MQSDRIFSSSVSEVYERRFVPLVFETYAEDMAARLVGMSHGSILEVAAGTGVVTRAMARTLPDLVTITATDLNQAMLDQAERAGTSRPVRWQQADALDLPYADGTFDVVVCQFGVMFLAPKAEAFAELRRVLRPGGRLLFNVWASLEDNEFAATVIDAVNRSYEGEPSMFFQRTPHGYHDEATIRADLRAGGFEAEALVERVDRRSHAESPRDVALAFCTGTPLRAELEGRGTGELRDAIDAAIAALGERFGETELEGRISALVVDVTAPAAP